MPPFRARLLGRPIVLAALVLAVLVGASVGAGYAAMRSSATAPAAASARLEAMSPRTAPSTAPLVWHQLKLLNGWVSAASFGTGSPEYARSAEGVVYFAGSLKNGNTNLAAFVMPVGTRPGFYDCFAVYSNDSSGVQGVGAFHIYANGKAYLQGPTAASFSSLSGLNYVVGH
jgi:hypothetical protein